MVVLRSVVMIAALVLGGCTVDQVKKEVPLFSSGEQELAFGIKYYEDGNYGHAQEDIQSAIASGLSTASETKAHKYLAFIHCISGREGQCRDEFRRMLEISPSQELTPAEAGHPVWGPVFRSVKLSAKSKK
ncbi:MAG: TssQ family T6SS-associated lipoprotein [Pseudomonadota bacterium]